MNLHMYMMYMYNVTVMRDDVTSKVKSQLVYYNDNAILLCVLAVATI